MSSLLKGAVHTVWMEAVLCVQVPLILCLSWGWRFEPKVRDKELFKPIPKVSARKGSVGSLSYLKYRTHRQTQRHRQCLFLKGIVRGVFILRKSHNPFWKGHWSSFCLMDRQWVALFPRVPSSLWVGHSRLLSIRNPGFTYARQPHQTIKPGFKKKTTLIHGTGLLSLVLCVQWVYSVLFL